MEQEAVEKMGRTADKATDRGTIDWIMSGMTVDKVTDRKNVQ